MRTTPEWLTFASMTDQLATAPLASTFAPHFLMRRNGTTSQAGGTSPLATESGTRTGLPGALQGHPQAEGAAPKFRSAEGNPSGSLGFATPNQKR